MSEIKERPILFSGEMVKAILDGRKTMTRRVIKFPFVDVEPDRILAGCFKDPKTGRVSGQCYEITCPYGQPGDRLWVRETWAEYGFGHPIYRATIPDAPGAKWKPSIFMPRWASRILLEITAVWVERVQDIGEEDAEREGFRWCNEASPVDMFMFLWDKLNAKRGYGWESNCFVWVLTFKKV